MNPRRLLILAALMLFAHRLGLACERFAVPPVQANQELVAFEGVVTAHLPAAAIRGLNRLTPGIVVKVTSVVLNTVLSPAVEVYPLTDDVSCEAIPRGVRELEQQYPVSARVAVMGRLVPKLDEVPYDAIRVQVVTWPSDLGGAARVPAHVPMLASGRMDFDAFRATYEPNSYGQWSNEVAWRNTHRYWYEDYEFLRCLLALEAIVEPKEKEHQLDNMGHYSRYAHVNEKLGREQYRALVVRAKVPRRARHHLLQTFDNSHGAR